MIVGGYAVGFHAWPRFTDDLDILVYPDRENADKVLAALADFGFGALDLTPEDLTTEGTIIQLGRPPLRIDIITSIQGIDNDTIFTTRVPAKADDIPVHYIGLECLIRNKRAVGRHEDLADLDRLEKRKESET